ncbi:unnamed protein product [Amoebophrya sp. A120]|nr:unnamed protein product [Amoebophrya sp. A120]|eukprot:GSA120T00006427001.1
MSDLEQLVKRVLNNTKDGTKKLKVEEAVKALERYDVDDDAIETFTVNSGRINTAEVFEKFAIFCKKNCAEKPLAQRTSLLADAAGEPSAKRARTTTSPGRAAVALGGTTAIGATTGSAGAQQAGGSSSSTSNSWGTGKKQENTSSYSQHVPTPVRGGVSSGLNPDRSALRTSAGAVVLGTGGGAAAQSNKPLPRAILRGCTSIEKQPLQAVIPTGMESRLTFHDSLPSSFHKEPVAIDTDYPQRTPVEYNFLDLNVERRALATNARLEDMESLMRLRIAEDDENVQRGQVGEVQQVTQEISVVGRILCDEEATSSTTAASKLNESSLLLEGSRSESNGQRMYFLTQDCDRVSTFPGQIVYAVGRGEKERLHANRFIGGVPVPARELPTSNSAAPPVHILCASGPFSKRSELNYSCLRSVLQYALAAKPQMVILMGPFLDCNNTVVREGGVMGEEGQEDLDPVDLTESFLLPILEDATAKLKESGCELVIVPSPDEATFLFATPQPPYPSFFLSEGWFRLQELGAHLVPNPCFLRINNSFTISCTTQDPLSPLVRSLLTRPEPESGGKLEEVMRHLLRQRSWFPRDGVEKSSSVNQGMQQPQSNIDVARRERYEFIRKTKNGRVLSAQEVEHEQAGGDQKLERAVAEDVDIAAEIEDCIPDILLFYSNVGRGFLANFVEDRLFVNPGPCSKTGQHGTFAELFVHPREKQLARVEIKKIPDQL